MAKPGDPVIIKHPDGMMAKDFVCPHGVKTGWWGKQTQSWMGPLSRCECCGSTFGYIDSGNMSGKHSWGSYWFPKLRCSKCGGYYKEYGEKPSART